MQSCPPIAREMAAKTCTFVGNWAGFMRKMNYIAGRGRQSKRVARLQLATLWDASSIAERQPYVKFAVSFRLRICVAGPEQTPHAAWPRRSGGRSGQATALLAPA